MRFINLFFILTFIGISSSQAKVREFITKQALNKIRFLSSDGKITYYKKNSGELQMSTNYKVKNILSFPKNTEYTISVSDEKLKTAIEVNKYFYQKNNFNLEREIYVKNYGVTDEPQKIGMGIHATLENGDKNLLAYSQKKKSIQNFNLLNNQTKEVTLQNKLNPFFIPHYTLITPNDLVYTDINDKGFSAALLYSFTDNSFKTIYKAKSNQNKIEFCRIKENLFLGEFPIVGLEKISRIYKIPLFNNPNFTKKELIYSNEVSDIGNMTCLKDRIFFVKSFYVEEKLNKKITDIVSLETKTNKLERITNFQNITQLIKMDDLILSFYKRKYYLIYGKAQNLSDAIIKGGEK